MKAKYDFQFEKFKDIYEFNKTINSRCNNAVMIGRSASQKEGKWSGTQNYEKSETYLTKGWTANVEDMKDELKKYSAQIERTRMKYKADIAGFAPIVPASIKGVPKAMWRGTPQKKIEKKKYLHIYFNNTGNCDQTNEELMQSGMAVLKLCILLEKLGIKVKIDIMPIVTECNKSIYGCGIEIKDYKQPFNMQKMAYPIAHTSMFRRQGFKWLETFPNCKEQLYRNAYGHSITSYGEMEKAYLEHFKMNESGSIYITYYDCKSVGFNPEKIAEMKGLHLTKK